MKSSNNAEENAITGAVGNQAVDQLLQGCGHCLDQCDQILRQVSAPDYIDTTGTGSSVGAHMRHILDRFQSFFSGLQSGRIDYDTRKRDPEVESNLEAATFSLATISRRIEEAGVQALGLGMLGQDIQVRESVHQSASPVAIRSTVERELMALVSHSIHHLAIIALMLKPLGYQLPADFGKAPSTIRYEQQAPIHHNT